MGCNHDLSVKGTWDQLEAPVDKFEKIVFNRIDCTDNEVIHAVYKATAQDCRVLCKGVVHELVEPLVEAKATLV